MQIQILQISTEHTDFMSIYVRNFSKGINYDELWERVEYTFRRKYRRPGIISSSLKNILKNEFRNER